MFGVFLKLLIFRVMIARAIKHWLQALRVLVKKNLNYLCGCTCVCVSENECVRACVRLCFRQIFYIDVRFLMLCTKQIFPLVRRRCDYLLDK